MYFLRALNNKNSVDKIKNLENSCKKNSDILKEFATTNNKLSMFSAKDMDEGDANNAALCFILDPGKSKLIKDYTFIKISDVFLNKNKFTFEANNNCNTFFDTGSETLHHDVDLPEGISSQIKLIKKLKKLFNDSKEESLYLQRYDEELTKKLVLWACNENKVIVDKINGKTLEEIGDLCCKEKSTNYKLVDKYLDYIQQSCGKLMSKAIEYAKVRSKKVADAV